MGLFEFVLIAVIVAMTTGKRSIPPNDGPWAQMIQKRSIPPSFIGSDGIDGIPWAQTSEKRSKPGSDGPWARMIQKRSIPPSFYPFPLARMSEKRSFPPSYYGIQRSYYGQRRSALKEKNVARVAQLRASARFRKSMRRLQRAAIHLTENPDLIPWCMPFCLARNPAVDEAVGRLAAEVPWLGWPSYGRGRQIAVTDLATLKQNGSPLLRESVQAAIDSLAADDESREVARHLQMAWDSPSLDEKLEHLRLAVDAINRPREMKLADTNEAEDTIEEGDEDEDADAQDAPEKAEDREAAEQEDEGEDEDEKRHVFPYVWDHHHGLKEAAEDGTSSTEEDEAQPKDEEEREGVLDLAHEKEETGDEEFKKMQTGPN